jgi:VanZ family protein
MNLNTRFLKVLFYFFSIIVILLSVNPFNKKLIENASGFRIDYLEHFLIVFIWALLFIITRLPDVKNYKTHIYLITTGILFSFIIEAIQYFIPTRSLNLIDFIMNLAGFFAGYIFGFIFIKIFVYYKR